MTDQRTLSAQLAAAQEENRVFQEIILATRERAERAEQDHKAAQEEIAELHELKRDLLNDLWATAGERNDAKAALERAEQALQQAGERERTLREEAFDAGAEWALSREQDCGDYPIPEREEAIARLLSTPSPEEPR